MQSLGARTSYLVDSGSMYNIGPFQLAKYGHNRRPVPESTKLVGASGGPLIGACIVDLDLTYKNMKLGLHEFFILDQSCYLRYAILGISFLTKNKAIIDFDDKTIEISHDNKLITINYDSLKPKQANEVRAEPTTVNVILDGELHVDDVVSFAGMLERGKGCDGDENVTNEEVERDEDLVHILHVGKKKLEIIISDNEDDHENVIYDTSPENVKLDHLDLPTQKKVREVIWNNQSSFAKNSEDLGCVPYGYHHACIHVEDGKYAYSSDYKRNPKELSILKKLEHRLVRQGVLAPNEHNPVHRSVNMVVKKPGAKVLSIETARFISDLRKTNSILKAESSAHGTMPNIESIRENLRGFTHLTKLDFTNAFFAIQVRKSDQYKLATSGVDKPAGYRYLRLPQGLRSSPQEMNFCTGKLKESITDVIDGIEVKNHIQFYVDDAFIWSNQGVDFHLKILDIFLKKTAEWGFLIKLSKCEFLVQKTLILGLVVDPLFTHMSEDKCQAIKCFAVPQTKKELRSFLGMASYLRNFIPKFCVRASKLYDLLKKDVPDKISKAWDIEHNEAFEDIKGALTEHTRLAIPNYGKDHPPWY